MSTDDDKNYWRQRLDEARKKRDRLPESGRIRAAMPALFFEELEKYIDDLGDPRYWPPFFGFLLNKPDDSIASLESDLDLVLQACEPNTHKSLTQFIRADVRNSRNWYGGLFDVWARATLLKEGDSVEFDVPLPNRRDTDMRLQLHGRRIRLENTVLTEDDESRDVWDRFLDDKDAGNAEYLNRPGPYDPPDAKGPSPYYNTLRLYGKVYDKLAKNLDPAKSQFGDVEPNVLMLSFCGIGVRPNDPGYGWALDELFTTRSAGRVVKAPHLQDISLDAWMEFTLDDMRRKGTISDDEYDYRMRRYGEIVDATRRLSGVLLFDGFELASARINYNAHDACLLTHADMAELQRRFSEPPSYG